MVTFTRLVRIVFGYLDHYQFASLCLSCVSASVGFSVLLAHTLVTNPSGATGAMTGSTGATASTGATSSGASSAMMMQLRPVLHQDLTVALFYWWMMIIHRLDIWLIIQVSG